MIKAARIPEWLALQRDLIIHAATPEESNALAIKIGEPHFSIGVVSPLFPLLSHYTLKENMRLACVKHKNDAYRAWEIATTYAQAAALELPANAETLFPEDIEARSISNLLLLRCTLMQSRAIMLHNPASDLVASAYSLQEHYPRHFYLWIMIDNTQDSSLFSTFKLYPVEG